MMSASIQFASSPSSAKENAVTGYGDSLYLDVPAWTMADSRSRLPAVGNQRTPHGQTSRHALGVCPLGKEPYRPAPHGKDSDWVRNIKAHPEVTVILGRKRLRATMRVLDHDSDRRRALAVISSSWTISGLTARKHFSLLGMGEHLDSASQEGDRLIVLLEPRQVR